MESNQSLASRLSVTPLTCTSTGRTDLFFGLMRHAAGSTALVGVVQRVEFAARHVHPVLVLPVLDVDAGPLRQPFELPLQALLHRSSLPACTSLLDFARHTTADHPSRKERGRPGFTSVGGSQQAAGPGLRVAVVVRTYSFCCTAVIRVLIIRRTLAYVTVGIWSAQGLRRNGASAVQAATGMILMDKFGVKYVGRIERLEQRPAPDLIILVCPMRGFLLQRSPVSNRNEGRPVVGMPLSVVSQHIPLHRPQRGSTSFTSE